MDNIDTGDFGELLREIKSARNAIEARDKRTSQRLDGVEQSLNELYLRHGRPGAEPFGELGAETKDLREWLIERHALVNPKDDGGSPWYEPMSAEIDNAKIAKRALRKFFRTGDVKRLDPLEVKSLTSFSMGESWVIPPTFSNRILSCLTDPSDITGLVSQESISASAIEYPIDNVAAEEANWACQANCYHNNPGDWLKNGLGTLTIKPEPLRFVACSGSDLLEDASFNVEQ